MEKNKSFSLTLIIEMGKKMGHQWGCTVSAASGYSNKSNVQVRIHATGRLNDFFYLSKVLLIKLIVPVGNKFWCRLCCIQYLHCSHIHVKNKKWESSKDFKEAFFKVLDWLQPKWDFVCLGAVDSANWFYVFETSPTGALEKKISILPLLFCPLLLLPLDFLQPSYPTARSPRDELLASIVLFPLVQVGYLLISFLFLSRSISLCWEGR